MLGRSEGIVALGALVVASLALAGCVLSPVDLNGRRCPCAPGWVCTHDLCVPASQALDAGHDAGHDAGDPGRDAGDDAAIDAGGAIDAGVDVDAGPDPTHCDDEYADALFCDGYEFDSTTGDRGGWGWDFVVMGSAQTIDDPPARVGTRSLRATIDASGGRAVLGADLPSAIMDGELWLRGWYYLPSDLTVDSISLLYVGSLDGSAGIALQMYGGGQVSGWIGTSGDWHGTTAPIPRDTWACLQLHVVVADMGGTVELYLDDVVVGRYENVDTLPIAAGGFQSIEAGIEYSGSTQPAPATLYVDEVVLSRTRVACH